MKLIELFEDNKSAAQGVYDRWLATKEGEQAIDEVRDMYPGYQDAQLDDAADWLMDRIRDFAESNGIDFDSLDSDVADLVINGLM